MSAQSKTLSADYKGSKSEWESVIREDSSNQLAMRGLAKAYFAEGDYKTAREYAKAGYDFVTYSQALGKTGSEFINKNFVWIFLLAVAVIGAAVIFTVEASKKQIVLIRNAKVRLLFNTVTHPFDSFNSIKYKNMGSLGNSGGAYCAVLYHGGNFRNVKRFPFQPRSARSHQARLCSL